VRVVLDTNVFVSAVFFGGVPGQLLGLWRDGALDLLLTAEILAEYEDVVYRLRERYPSVDPGPIIRLVVHRGVFVQAVPLAERVCDDPDDDKFLSAAIAGASRVVVSGDGHLLDASGWQQIEVLTPALFMERLRRE
jgi:putative PIN family toxin of toxin-antitoxin system